MVLRARDFFDAMKFVLGGTVSIIERNTKLFIFFHAIYCFMIIFCDV